MGRIVVWVDAADDVSTEMISRIDEDRAERAVAEHRSGPIAANTSSALSGLPRPMPSVPVPANATEATATST